MGSTFLGLGFSQKEVKLKEGEYRRIFQFRSEGKMSKFRYDESHENTVL